MKYASRIALFLVPTILGSISLVRADDSTPNLAAQSDKSSYNFEATDGIGTSRAYQQELGARLYKISSSNIFTAIDYSHYFGESHSVRDINLVSAEGGYRFQTATNFELIPYVGLGGAFLNQTNHQGAVDHLLTSPGLKVDYPIGQLVLGLDNQYLTVPNHNAYSMAATFGIRL